MGRTRAGDGPRRLGPRPSASGRPRAGAFRRPDRSSPEGACRKTMSFPTHRYRRLRLTDSLREMVRETSLEPSDFIAPLFVVPGEGVRAGRPVDARRRPDVVRAGRKGREGALFARREVGDPLRDPGSQGRARDLFGRSGGPRLPGGPRDQVGEPGDGRDDRRLPLRVHGPRTLRRPEGGDRRQRPDARDPRGGSARAREGRGRRRRAVRHDGRTRCGDPEDARRERIP